LPDILIPDTHVPIAIGHQKLSKGKNYFIQNLNMQEKMVCEISGLTIIILSINIK
jgi:hypothetical protein